MERTEMNIHQKLLKIADAAGILQKTKSGYNYKYVPEEEIQAKVTAGMQKYGVMLYHSIVPGTLQVMPYTYQKTKDKTINEFIVHADTIYTWVNVDKPEETVEVPWVLVGQMEDASQAFGAAETYCNRYFLMKSLQLATSEADPDNYRSKQKEAENYDDEKVLNAAVKEVVAMGSQLIKSGIAKDEVMGIVGKYNNGNQNPSSIKSIEVCTAVMKEFETLAANKPATTKKTTKGESK
ncbi:MAG: ERF family protein [Clostridia bacterium]|nr:ERF family protein [Clostridia bacterium]